MICVNNVPGIIFIKINTDEMSQNFLCKKDIHLLMVFKAQEFANNFITTANGFEMRIISADKGASNVSISKIHAYFNITDFMLRLYVACIMMMIGLLERL